MWNILELIDGLEVAGLPEPKKLDLISATYETNNEYQHEGTVIRKHGIFKIMLGRTGYKIERLLQHSTRRDDYKLTEFYFTTIGEAAAKLKELMRVAEPEAQPATEAQA